jgi:hypothetical protein
MIHAMVQAHESFLKFKKGNRKVLWPKLKKKNFNGQSKGFYDEAYFNFI